MLRRLVKFVVFLALLGALVAGVLAAVGMGLPENHEATRAAVIPSPIESVFATINTPETYPEWRKDVEKVELLGNDRFREFGPNGPMVLRITEREPFSKLVVALDDPEQPFTGAWTVELEPDRGASDRTRVRITERGSVPNPLFRAIAKFTQLPTDSIDRYLKALGRRFGVDVTIED